MRGGKLCVTTVLIVSIAIAVASNSISVTLKSTRTKWLVGIHVTILKKKTMKKIDFYEKKKALHNEMLEAMKELFAKTSIDEFDFMPDDGDWQRNCFVTLCPNGADRTREVLVRKVKCMDGEIYILPYGGDMWISCEHAGDVVTCTLDDVYDALYGAVGDINHVYYVCELDENGKPTGKVTKETWRLEYAESMIESRGFIYNDFETALLHAQYEKYGKS